ncbi:hypothetical protein EVB88_052 [Rhizobium phage RHph_N28_2]|nr:hypothetical protein EVB88_052 [Rhizobium phage RHph_N28_2]
MTDTKHTALPWKVVSVPHFDSGLVYTSIQPVNVDEEAMKPLAMMNGEFHICRMSHTAAPWRFNYYRDNAAFIVEACNSYYQNLDAIAIKDAEIARLRAALFEIATTDDYRGLSAEEAMSVAQAALKSEGGAANG